MSDQPESNQNQLTKQKKLPPVLPESVPVIMPNLPARYAINSLQQFKAISDSTRTRILGIIQNQPATAKQIADRLGATPGAIGHHLSVLEEAGLVQIMARRLVRGIVANYFTRTARIFEYNFPREVSGEAIPLDFITKLRAEFTEALPNLAQDEGKGAMSLMGFPHARLSQAKVEAYARRLQAFVDDLLAEPPDPDGDVYGFFYSVFKAPAYMQGKAAKSPPVEMEETNHSREIHDSGA